MTSFVPYNRVLDQLVSVLILGLTATITFGALCI